MDSVDWHMLLAGSSRRFFEEGGFSPSGQQDGLWHLTPVRKELAASRHGIDWRDQLSRESTYAHYDPVNRSWQVSRHRAGTRSWQPGHRLSGEEKAVIARIAHERDMLVDAASALRDDPLAYRVLGRVLMQMARDSAEPDAVRRMGAVIEPYQFLGAPAASVFRVSVFADLRQHAEHLYRQVAGRSPGATADTPLCPPCEPADYLGLARGEPGPGAAEGSLEIG